MPDRTNSCPQMHEGPVPRSGPPPLAPAPLWPTLLEPLAGPNTEEMPLECSGRRRSHDQRLHIGHPAAPPKRLAPPATTTPKNDVKADARRRPPTIARPSLHACILHMQHAFLRFLEKVPIQVGPRFVKTTHSYDSFHGTSHIHESFSCKLVVTYRVMQMTR